MRVDLVCAKDTNMEHHVWNPVSVLCVYTCVRTYNTVASCTHYLETFKNAQDKSSQRKVRIMAEGGE